MKLEPERNGAPLRGSNAIRKADVPIRVLRGCHLHTKVWLTRSAGLPQDDVALTRYVLLISEVRHPHACHCH